MNTASLIFRRKFLAYESQDYCMVIKWDAHIVSHTVLKPLIPIMKNIRETGKNTEKFSIKYKAGAVKQNCFVGGSNTGSNPVLETGGVMVSLCLKFLFD
ncbi:hypothetical protein N0B40_11750 [Chryseobacterium oranimense]|uniref:hypothetical protein n=1 Tax=Chryseobacterium oranimense TaxID=421058 RepID=UPI0021AF805C|nr:hypothetical protein [Chryseobacterium oranimense]UWX59113.1 hypothetical protein N0B40_11750 [Chryseobacterium oranimense]